MSGGVNERQRSRGMKQRYCASYNTQEEIIFYFNVFYMLIIMMYFVGFYVSVNVPFSVCETNRAVWRNSRVGNRSRGRYDSRSPCVFCYQPELFEQNSSASTQPPLDVTHSLASAQCISSVLGSSCWCCCCRIFRLCCGSLTRSLTAHGICFVGLALLHLLSAIGESVRVRVRAVHTLGLLRAAVGLRKARY